MACDAATRIRRTLRAADGEDEEAALLRPPADMARHPRIISESGQDS